MIQSKREASGSFLVCALEVRMADMVVEHDTGRYEVRLNFCERMFVECAVTECHTCGGVITWLSTNDGGWDYMTHAGYRQERHGSNPDEYRQMEARKAIDEHLAGLDHNFRLAGRAQSEPKP